jgi:hypothetical protein
MWDYRDLYVMVHADREAIEASFIHRVSEGFNAGSLRIEIPASESIARVGRWIGAGGPDSAPESPDREPISKRALCLSDR